MDRAQKLQQMTFIIIVGFAIAVIFHYVRGVYTGLGYPYDTFLYPPKDRFGDFFNPVWGSSDRDPYNPDRVFVYGGYLPFGYLVPFLFSLIRPLELSFLLLTMGFLGFLIWYVKRSLYGDRKMESSDRLSIFALTTLAYPVLMVLDRANFDMLLFIFIAMFAMLYQANHKTLATLLLAVPIAMKGYPLVLLTIPLLDKQLRAIIITGVLVITLEIISLAVFDGGIVVEVGKMATSFAAAVSISFVMGNLVRFNSSLYTMLLFLDPALLKAAWFNYGYVVALLIAYAAISVIMYIKRYPFWQQLMVISLIMMLFPQSTNDYRLIMLYPPMLMFLSRSEQTPTDALTTLLLALLLIPKAYYVFANAYTGTFTDVNIGIIINPILLLILLIIMVVPPSSKNANPELSPQ
jgi:hypothetical protein